MISYYSRKKDKNVTGMGPDTFLPKGLALPEKPAQAECNHPTWNTAE
jgi:hypothetical protein